MPILGGGAGWRCFAVACVVTCLALPGSAVAGWDPPEPVPPGTDVFRLALAPGGPGYVVGFPVLAPSPGRFRYALRPLGGTLSPVPMELPGTVGTNFDGFWTFDAAGDAVIANTYDGRIGYLPVGGIGGSSQDLPPGYYPDAVSVAPTGEALIAAAPSTGTFRVSLRPAGAGQTADFSVGGSQLFGGPSAGLIGLLLQADGGAVVVWQEGDTLYQSVRPGGQASFGAPTAVGDPRPDVRKFSVRMRGDSSGHAMLAWLGSSGGNARDQAVASVREPDGAFGPAQVVGSVSTPGSMVNVTPSVTSSGDGLVVWSHRYAEGTCPASTAMGAAFHAGAFAPQQPLGPDAFPLISSQGFPDTVLAAGDRVAVPLLEIEDVAGTPCSYGDDRRGLFLHHFHSGPNGLVDDGISELSPLQARAGGATSYPSINEQAIEPGGRMLVEYQVDAAKYLRSFDGVAPGASGPASPSGPTAPVGGGPAPTTPAAPVAPKPILPIRPVQYFKPAPIDPKLAQVTLTCTPDIDGEACRARMLAYYLFKGRNAGKASVAAKKKAKTKTVLIARATATIPNGKTRKVRLKFTKAGRTLIARGKRVKIVLDLTITRGSRSAKHRFSTTLKARRAARR